MPHVGIVIPNLSSVVCGVSLGGMLHMRAWALCGRRKQRVKFNAVTRPQTSTDVQWHYVAAPSLPVQDSAQAAAAMLLRRELEHLLLSLTEREAGVLRMRFGLDDGMQRTCGEVGEAFGVGSGLPCGQSRLQYSCSTASDGNLQQGGLRPDTGW